MASDPIVRRKRRVGRFSFIIQFLLLCVGRLISRNRGVDDDQLGLRGAVLILSQRPFHESG
jgi:hypothetical protein